MNKLFTSYITDGSDQLAGMPDLRTVRCEELERTESSGWQEFTQNHQKRVTKLSIDLILATVIKAHCLGNYKINNAIPMPGLINTNE